MAICKIKHLTTNAQLLLMELEHMTVKLYVRIAANVASVSTIVLELVHWFHV